MGRGDAAAETWIFRGDARRRRGYAVYISSRPARALRYFGSAPGLSEDLEVDDGPFRRWRVARNVALADYAPAWSPAANATAPVGNAAGFLRHSRSPVFARRVARYGGAYALEADAFWPARESAIGSGADCAGISNRVGGRLRGGQQSGRGPQVLALRRRARGLRRVAPLRGRWRLAAGLRGVRGARPGGNQTSRRLHRASRAAWSRRDRGVGTV